MNTELLTAKVGAVNKANKYANELSGELVRFFTDYVGKKILKADGTLLAKIAALAPKFKNSTSISVYRQNSNFTLAWVVKTCEPLPPHSCVYHETTIWVGDLDNGLLKGVREDKQPYKTDFSVEEISKKREEYEKVKNQLDEIEGDLYPFGV